MAEALYRKYRPNTFAEVAEQQHVVRTVTNQLRDGKVAHAYLFAGPRGVGKTTIARLLAKALNCETRKEGEAEPCGACGACLEMRQGRFMDLVEIDAASQSKVEETRENIIENVRFAPTRGKFKVFIIDEVHMLSTASFNAILKTLEEPPAHVVFILATTELHKIPATIISRCQRFDFHRVPPKEMIERLQTISKAEGFTVDEKVLASIARLSEGCLRDAESLLGQLFSLGETTIGEDQASLILPATHTGTVAEIAEAVAKKDVETALKTVNSFVDGGGSLRHLIDELLEYVRSMLFASLGFLSTEQYDPSTLQKLNATAKLASSDVHRRFLDALLTARTRQSISALPQIPLEIAIVEATGGQDGLNGQIGHSEPRPVVAPAPAPTPTPAPAFVRPTAPPPQPLQPSQPSSAFQVSDFDLPPSTMDTEHATPPPVTGAGLITPPSQASAPTTGALPFTLDELIEKWGRCCAHVGERNMSMPLILGSSKPVAIDGSTITISLAYQFHVKAMEDQKSQRLVQEAIGAIMMAMPTQILCIIEKGKEPNNPVDTLVEAFGGQVL
ncbi:MAG: DNA polymerase III subunit gamma/tau [Patescibacteria group bacterium]|jgi:DNA polymerase-3 subunit gamma/tau